MLYATCTHALFKKKKEKRKKEVAVILRMDGQCVSFVTVSVRFRVRVSSDSGVYVHAEPPVLCF